MTQFDIPLAELTMPQKLELFEALWNDLARNSTGVTSPPWHEEILKEREKALATGENQDFRLAGGQGKDQKAG